LPEGQPTLPSLFKAAGYYTALIGKWHLAGGKSGPAKAGYDYFYGFLPGATDYFRRPTEKEAATVPAAGPESQSQPPTRTARFCAKLFRAPERKKTCRSAARPQSGRAVRVQRMQAYQARPYHAPRPAPCKIRCPCPTSAFR
jgi:arylsulfatase A-like enzyme